MQPLFALRSALLVLACALAAQAQSPVPSLLSFQGRLSSAAGAPLVGPVALTVRIYAAPSGGVPLYEEVQNPTALAGVVHVLLGSVTPLPANLFDGSPRYLALAVNGDAEMSPRRDVTSVPYALRAKSADGLSAGASLPAAIVDAAALATGAVTSSKLATAAVGTAALASNSVTGTKVASSSLDGGHIADGSIKSADITDGGVASVDLATGAVGSAQIADGSIAAADLATGSVGSSEIADGSVAAGDLAAGAVTASALAAGSVTSPTLALASVNAGHVVDGSLGGAEVLDGSITASDLATDAVGSAEIAAGAVGASEIADGAVGANEIADGSVGNAELALSAGLGIGTTSPQADLHVRGASSPGSLIVAPGLANSQAQLLLSENTGGSIGVLVRYDGASTNDLQVLGKSSGIETGPHLSVNRDNGIVKVPGELRAGPGATATPRAYGSVNTNGSKLGGSSNWTVLWNATLEFYEVHVTGVDYNVNDHCMLVTPFLTTELVAPMVMDFSDSGAAYVMFGTQHLPGFPAPSKKVGFSFALYEF